VNGYALQHAPRAYHRATAKALSLSVPPSLQQRAYEVIECGGASSYRFSAVRHSRVRSSARAAAGKTSHRFSQQRVI